MSSPRPFKSQYHHVIPRFILKRYKQTGSAVLSPAAQRKGKQSNSAENSIYYYDVLKGELQLRSIATVYGVTNLYMDASNPSDVMELEKKLAVLEGKAAKVITKIHDTVSKTPTISLNRREVEDLRKFLFVMYYRKENLAHTFFEEDHPENAPARAWMQEYRKKYGLKSTADFWLHVLRYYLDTRHEQICKDYYDIVKKYGPAGLGNMMQGTIHPSIKFEAMAYGAQAGSFVTSIWKAAEGEEFLLGHNGFGLWEGLCMGQPAIHRIFVVSPRIAIVHRNRMATAGTSQFRIPGLPAMNNSDLLDIPTPSADVDYLGAVDISPINNSEELMEYKASLAAQNDVFTFTVTKLTIAQTDAFNAVVLRNVKPDGSLTFLSAPVALEALRRYRSSTEPENVLTKHLFTNLIKILANLSRPTPLSAPTRSVNNSADSSCPSTKAPLSKNAGATPIDDTTLVPATTSSAPDNALLLDTLTSSDALTTAGPHQAPTHGPPSDSQSVILEDRLRALFAAELDGTSTFASPYSAAHAIWRLCNHDEMPQIPPRSELRRLSNEAYSRFSSPLRPPADRDFQAHLEYRLRRDVSAAESTIFFTRFKEIFEMLGIPVPSERRTFQFLLLQASMVGFAERLAQTRHDVLNMVLKDTGLQILDLLE